MTRRLQDLYYAVGPRRLLALGLAFVAISLILFTGLFTSQVSLRAGQSSPRDIYAPRREVNQPLYEALRQQASRSVKPVYVTDQTATAQMQQKIQRIFTSVTQMQSSLPANASANAMQAAWTEQVGLSLPQADVVQILKLKASDLGNLDRLATAVASHVLAQANYQVGQLTSQRDALALGVESLGLPQAAETYFLTAVERASATPNMRVSKTETARAVQQALASVPQPIVDQGQLIVARGQRVTLPDLQLLRQYGLLHGQSNWPAAAGAVLMALGALGALLAYVYRFFRQGVADERHLNLLLSVFVGELLLARLTLLVSPDLIPLAAMSVLLAMLYDARIGLGVAIITALLLEAAFGIDPQAGVVLAAQAFVGALAVQRLSDRSQLLQAALYIAVTGLIVNGTLLLASAPYAPAPDFWGNMGWILVNSALSVAFALAAAPLFENSFGVLTSLRLLELSAPNQPLLRRLLLEAPGTYYHSLVVSNLAGAGCDAIGAQSLLARVGAFYHDIGKLRRPYFFIDNQTDMENPHDKLSPMLSTLVITAHVKDGLEMAKEYRLPKELWQFIGEHHGTTLVQYFYQKAVEHHPETPPREEDFRYEGPKPQSRETAVLMLADTCEAAVRAMRGRTTQGVEATVRRLVHERLADGQLDESDLTLRDLDLISKAFVRVLGAVHHTRVEYPEGLEELLRRQR
ncbi:MAG: HDIG domain-containing protein [Thermaerobacter sp.]|nr:HDIG domain-containing protein [Thermaerobacter sp.]